MRSALLATVVIVMAATSSAQWLHYPTPGIPRLANGKPDLLAPAPKTADGKPESQNNKDSTLAQCLPHFMGHIVPLTLYKIVQTPGPVVMLFDGQGMPLPRQIFTDGRPLPENPNPSWLGYSVGRWEGGALVVETIGFNDRGMVPAGVPMTETTRVTERFERTDFGHMKLQIIMEDPRTFTKP